MDTSVKTVHYLGSKVRMLSPIKRYIDELTHGNGRICDLFCGSGVVSEYLLQQYDVLAVDIQNYSKVYCEARLLGLPKDFDYKGIIARIKESETRRTNLIVYKPILVYEDECRGSLLSGELEPIYEVIEKGSLYAYLNNLPYSETDLSPSLEKAFAMVKDTGGIDLQSLDSIITRYYGGLYFSFKQAIDIDAISSYAFAQNERVKNAMLAALMGATTDVVNTIGKQFAQPLKVRNKDGSLKKNLAKKILSDRELDVFEQFEKWMQYYVELPQNTHDFEIICDDYMEVLKRLQPGDVEVIYADPPYTRYHYSRYYHILETRAIYRNDRHQSPFCIKSKAPQAFDDLFMYASKAQASIVLSYSPFDVNSGATPRLLSIEDIISIAQKYYKDVSVVSPGQFMHSRFNRQDNNYEINYEAEKLVICRR